jgi:hypothetical protein
MVMRALFCPAGQRALPPGDGRAARRTEPGIARRAADKNGYRLLT